MFRSRGMIRLGTISLIVSGFVALVILGNVVHPDGQALAGKPPKPSPPGDDVNIIQQDTPVRVRFYGAMGRWNDTNGNGVADAGEIVQVDLVDGEDYLTCFAGRSRGINVGFGGNTQLVMAIELGELITEVELDGLTIDVLPPPPGPSDIPDLPLQEDYIIPDSFPKPDVGEQGAPNILVMSEDVGVTLGISENVSGLGVEIYPENLYYEEGIITEKRPRYGYLLGVTVYGPIPKFHVLPYESPAPEEASGYNYMFANARIQFTGPNGERWGIYFGKGPLDAIIGDPYDSSSDRVFTWRGAYYHYTDPLLADWVMIEAAPDVNWPMEGDAHWAVNNPTAPSVLLGYLWHKGAEAKAPKNNDPWYYVGAYKVQWSAFATTVLYPP